MFFVKSEDEHSLCPYCDYPLEYHSTVERQSRNIHGEKFIYMVSVLKCNNKACPKTYHRELPDFIVPYKRYDAESIEDAVTNDKADITVYADESTVNRWRKWFKVNAIYIIMALLSVAAIIGDNEGTTSLAIKTKHSRNPVKTIKTILRRETAWLNETVRVLVNSAKWVFNRSAFLTV